MAIQYTLTPRTTALDGKRRWVATARTSGEATLDDVARDVEKATTVSRADIKAVLSALEDRLCDYLSDGVIVRLGDVGTFRPTLRSKASLSPESFDASTLKAAASYRPSRRIRVALSGARKERLGGRRRKE